MADPFAQSVLDIFDEDWIGEVESTFENAGYMTLTQAKVLEFVESFADRETGRDPETFAREVLGHDPWEIPLQIMRELDKPSASVAVKACHASSKTFSAAEIALYYVCERGALVITTAPTDQQVKRLLWGEIKKFHANAREPLGGYMLDKSLKYSEQNYALGFSTDQAVRFSGFHGDLVVIIVDEAPGLREEIYDAIEGVRAGGDVRLLLIGNPVISGGTFEDAFKKKRSLWTTFTIDAYDTPNLKELNLHDPDQLEWFKALEPGTTEYDEIMAVKPRPYLITRDWVWKRLQDWGEDDPRYISRVRGGFPPFDEYSIFNLTWLEQAKVRKALKLPDPDFPNNPVILDSDNFEGGLDIAAGGDDETVLCIREGPKIHGVWAWTKGDSAAEVIILCKKYMRLAAIMGKKFTLKYDVQGNGYHYGAILKEAGIPTIAVQGQATPNDEEQFYTLKDELYFNFRDLLRDGYVCNLKDDDDILISQAVPIKWDVNAKGKTRVESKDSLKARGFSSPDRLEACIYAFGRVRKVVRGRNKRMFAGRRLRK
jgi:phage terminase large subunit